MALYSDRSAYICEAQITGRVIVYEPVPHFRAFLEYNIALNGLDHLVEVRHDIVSHVHNQPMTMVVPNAGIWGTAGIGGDNIDKNINSELTAT